MDSGSKSSEYLSTLEKGLRVLRSFTRENPEMTLSEVARATELNPAVVRRCLITLSELGYVGKIDNHFVLGPRVLELANQFNDTFNVDNTLRPVLQRLRDTTTDSASFAVLSQGDILYLSHVSTYRVIRLQAASGTRFPALNTSLGRAILSSWSEHEIRQFITAHPPVEMTDLSITDPELLVEKILRCKDDGWIVVSDELDYGVTSIAVPITIAGVGTVGAINSSAATTKVNLKTFAEERLPALLDTAEKITAQLRKAPVLLQSIRSMSK